MNCKHIVERSNIQLYVKLKHSLAFSW